MTEDHTGTSPNQLPNQEIRKKLSHILRDMSFTPIEKRIVIKLADGELHGIDEVLASIGDSQMSRQNMADHMVNLRKKLGRIGHYISCDNRGRRSYYRYVILLNTLIMEEE